MTHRETEPPLYKALVVGIPAECEGTVPAESEAPGETTRTGDEERTMCAREW